MTIPAPEPVAVPVSARRARTAVANRGETPLVQTAVSRHDDLAAPSGWPVYFAAFVVSALWICAPIAFAVGYRGDVIPFNNDIFALAVFALLAIGPAAFVWIAAYLVRQGQRLSAETRRARTLADELAAPALAAAARTGDVIDVIRGEISRAEAAAEEARDTLLALREALAGETERLTEAAAASVRTAQGLAVTLGLERTEMGALAQQLDSQSARVSDVISQQARMVAEASDLAETQLREAEAALAARAADLAAAATEVSDAVRTGGEDLNRHVARLENAGTGVAEQIRSIEGGLGAQREALATLTEVLRIDHQGFAAQAETHASQLAEFISQARLSASELGDRAVKGGETLRAMVVQAAEQFREMTEAYQGERDQFGRAAATAAGELSQVTAQERERLEAQTQAAIGALTQAAAETRAAAAAHAEAARHHVDQLSEAAFTAGQTANKAFEARLEEARRLIESSAEMIDTAGAATARKLEDGAIAARTALSELQRMLGEVEARAADLPEVAKGQAAQVRAAVTGSMEEMLNQARRAAAETQAIDQAFQGRVRRNYEMLSEAVRLMGSVAAAGALPSTPTLDRRAADLQPGPDPEPRLFEPPPQPVVRVQPPRRPPPEAPSAPDDLAQPPPPDTPTASPQPPETAAGLRPRLRLTPTATDTELTSIFDAAPAPAAEEPAPEGEGWSWKDLLSSIDDTGDPAKLQVALGRQVAEMGIEPAALLPTAKIEEIAAAVQTGDIDGARQVVRTLAPAANRRLTRMLFTDDELKRRARVFIAHQNALLAEAVAKDHGGFAVAGLLNTDAGRIYLVLDAAMGDIT